MMVGDPDLIGQWCIRVPAKGAEARRQELIAQGILDISLKPRREGNDVLLPVTVGREGMQRSFFSANPKAPALPRHELIGGIAVMQEDDPAGAEQILAARPNLHTVLVAASGVEGEYRTKRFTVLAGKPTTSTEVMEHGSRFTIDLSSAYFSARLATERQRIASLAGDGEVILDMFAGVGPFAIVLSPKAALVVAADINPGAVDLMLRNLAKNRVKNVLPVLSDARHLPAVLPWRFDRIVMNLPKSGEEFLPAAFRLAQPGGTIHFYALVSREREHCEQIEGLGGHISAERVVRSYSPGKWHAVYDIVVGVQ